jgi:flagellar biosynthetic protein FliP
MTGKLIKTRLGKGWLSRSRMLFLAFVVLTPAGFSFGQDANVVPVQPGLPGNTTTTSAAAPTAGLRQQAVGGIPSIKDLVTIIDKATTDETKGKDWSTPVKLVVIFTGLALLPSLLVMMTSFTRIAIVLSFIRRALTTQNIPPTIAMMGLALFLTLYTMAPTFTKANVNAIQPYLANEIDFQTAGTRAGDCIKEFMLRQCRETDLALFVRMARIEPQASPMDIDLHIVIPAFIVSEFRTAFEIGCLLFIPFLLMDIVIASVLLSAGMMLLPPMMISLPLKLVLFILVDGWGLLAESLSLSFR